MRKIFKYTIFLIVGVIIGMILMLFVQNNFLFSNPAQKTNKKVEEIYDIVENNYLHADDIDESILTDSTASGFVQGLGDPYATYYNEKDASIFLNNFSSNYISTGITYANINNNYVVVEVLENSSAKS